MTGEELYQLWVDANEVENCSVDPWESMDERDRAVWQYMAERLNLAD